MAIPEGRVTVDAITSLTQVTYDSKSDLVSSKSGTSSIAGNNATGQSNSPGELGTNGKPSVFVKKDKINIPQADKAIGNVDPFAQNDTANLPKTFKKSAFSLDLDRKLTEPVNLTFGNNISSIDKILSSTKELPAGKQIIKASDEAGIDKLIDNVGKTQIGNEFKKYMNKDIFSAKVKSSLTKVNSPFGKTLRSKLNMSKLLSPCKGLNFDIPNLDLNGLFNLSFMAGLFDGILCQGADSVVGFIQDVIKIDNTNAPMVLNAMVETMNKDHDIDVFDKLMITKAIKDNTTVKDANIYTKGVTDKILFNLGNIPMDTNSNVSRYTNIVDGLDSLDYNWDKDEDGNTNLSAVRGNKNIGLMADSYIASSSSSNTFTGDVTTNIDRVKTISILNHFA